MLVRHLHPTCLRALMISWCLIAKKRNSYDATTLLSSCHVWTLMVSCVVITEPVQVESTWTDSGSILMRNFSQRFSTWRNYSKGSVSKKNVTFGFTVTCMGIAKRKIHFSMVVTLQLMAASCHGQSSDFCLEFSHRKRIFLTSKTVVSKLNLTRSVQDVSSLGSNFKSLIVLPLKIHFLAMILVKMITGNFQRKIMRFWAVNFANRSMSSTMFGSRFSVS